MEPLNKLYSRLKTGVEGLSSKEAARRLKEQGPNALHGPKRGAGITLFFAQFKSPLVLLLIGAALLSFSLGSYTDSSIIFTIVILSGSLGFYQERGAINALESLLSLVGHKSSVLRDNKQMEVPIEELVTGDIVYLRAGDPIPADSILIDANHFFVDEAMLTGESSPVEKQAHEPVFMGSLVASGIAIAIIEMTGKETKYGKMADKVRFRPPETAFEIGVKRFGSFLLQITLFVTITLFALNIYLQKPLVESLLFSLAIAVGLTPQLLPAVISVNISHGVRRMAKKKVIVKRLASIENFGQMNILCSDKTGTITQGKMHLVSSLSSDGKASDKCALYAYLNAANQSGYANPLDSAILAKLKYDSSTWKKVSEIPYDFLRKKISIFFTYEKQKILISKGAYANIISACSHVEIGDGSSSPLSSIRTELDAFFEKKSKEGTRLVAVAYGHTPEEKNLTFLGFLLFSDPMKPHIAQTVSELKSKGVMLKILTGDRREVAAHAAHTLGFPHGSLITGKELSEISDAALLKIAAETSVFAEVEPNQKERVILALRKAGYVVGYLGDGVNDVSALHSADVGIAVHTGAPAAKEAADIVLLEKDLSVLQEGIEEGRRTFVNTMKYVLMATSANFGTMISMAGASLFLSFLPLLPKQVLFTNFLSDLPEMALATDKVDPEVLRRPVKWDLPLIHRFMLVFGILNAATDFLAFFALIFWYHADTDFFRTGWFIENTFNAALVVLAIRTKRLLFHSKPGLLLTIVSALVALLLPLLPYTALGRLFNLTPIPLSFYGVLFGITIFFFCTVEIAKYFFFRRMKRR